MAEVIEVLAEVGRFPKNSTSTLVARVLSVRGTRCGDLRIFAIGSAGEAVATRRGLCLRVEQLPELACLVAALVKAAGEKGKAHEGSGGAGNGEEATE